jgi:hypothetical protein
MPATINWQHKRCSGEVEATYLPIEGKGFISTFTCPDCLATVTVHVLYEGARNVETDFIPPGLLIIPDHIQ